MRRLLAAAGILVLLGTSVSALAQQKAQARTEPLVLTVTTNKKSYQPGGQISLTATVKNVSKKPIVLMKAIHDGGLAAWADAKIYHKGKLITEQQDESSMPIAQVMVRNDLTEDRFLTLKPGESAVVYTLKFTKYWDLRDKDPGLKASYEGAKTLNLSAGNYVIECGYFFNDKMRGDWHSKLEYSGNAEQLLKSAYRGELKAKTIIEVTQ